MSSRQEPSANANTPTEKKDLHVNNGKILRGQDNFTQWLRIFKTDAKNQRLWDWFTGEKTMPKQPKYEAYLRQEQEIMENMPPVVPQGCIVIKDFQHFKYLNKTWEKDDEQRCKAEKLFCERIDPSFVAVIQPFALLKEKYTIVESMCKVNDEAQLGILHSEMEALRLRRDMTMQEYINEHVMLQQDINDLTGGNYTEKQLKDKIIRGLPKTWRDFVDRYTFHTRSALKPMGFPEFCGLLLAQEAVNEVRLKQDKTNKPKENQSNTGKPTTNNERSKKYCTTCKKKGHTEDECYFGHPELAPPEWKQKGKDKQAALASADVDEFKQHMNSSSMSDPPLPKPDTDNQTQSDVKCGSVREDSKDSYKNGVGNNIDITKGINAFTTGNFDNSDTWLLDTGANMHICNNDKWFKQLQHFDMKINTANNEGAPLHIQGGGEVELNFLTPTNTKHSITLQDVGYAPSGRCNLMSAGLLALENKISTNLTDDKAIFYHNTQPVGQAIAENALYKISLTNGDTKSNEKPLAATIDFSDPVWEMHRKLGHLSIQNMLSLLKNSKGMNLTEKQIKDKLSTICPVCAMTKAVVKIPRDPATRHAQEPGGLVHADVWEYNKPAYDKTTRFMFFTDDATRFTWGRRMKTKADLVDTFKEMHLSLEKEHSMTIRKYRFDNEFMSNTITPWLKKKGIGIENTQARAHYQNGVAERNHRTVRDKAASMIQEESISKKLKGIVVEKGIELMKESKVPADLWPEAIERAIWCKNRSPARALRKKEKKTPWEALYGYEPDLTRESVWGSRTYVTLPWEDRNTADAKQGNKLHNQRAWIGYFMGFETEAMYRIYSPDKTKVFRVGVARVDHGEGLTDPQKKPSFTDTRKPKDRSSDKQNESESDSDSDRNSTSMAEVNLAKFNSIYLKDDDVENESIDEEESDTEKITIKDIPHFSPKDYHLAGRYSPASHKCQYCFVTRRTCDQHDVGRPCTQCKKRRAACQEQTRAVQKLLINPKKIDRHEIRKLKDKNTPIRKQQPLKGKPENQGVPVDDKCHSCFMKHQSCDGQSPCNKCQKSLRLRKRCVPQKDWLELTAKPSCTHCSGNGKGMFFCNRKRPCDSCIQYKRMCTYVEQGGAVKRIYLIPGVYTRYQPTWIKDGKGNKVVDTNICLQCRKADRNSGKTGCDGDAPCSRCIKTWMRQGKKTTRGDYTSQQRCTFFTDNNTVECTSIMGWHIDDQTGKKVLDDNFETPKHLPKNEQKVRGSHNQRLKIPNSERDGAEKEALWNSFPKGWVKIDTPGDNFLCGFYALLLSIQKQYPTIAPPTLKELKSILKKLDIVDENNFADDQLHDVLHNWGEKHGHQFQLGIILDDFGPYLIPQKGKADDPKVLWIHNDGNSKVDKMLGHWSGVRRKDNTPGRSNGYIKAKQQKQATKAHSDSGRKKPYSEGSSDEEEDSSQTDINDSEDDNTSEVEIEDQEEDEIKGTEDDDIHDSTTAVDEFSDADDSTDIESNAEASNVDDEQDIERMTHETAEEPAVSDSEDEDVFYLKRVSKRNRSDDDLEEFLKDQPPKKQPKYVNAVWIDPSGVSESELLKHPIPQSYNEMVKCPDAPNYLAALETEISNLQQAGTYEEVDISEVPLGMTPITGRAVFTRKLDGEGHIKKYKARIVARGFQQKEGINYDETYAMVAKPTSIRILIALAVLLGWHIHQMDAIAAFLNGRLKHTIYMWPPQGVRLQKGKLWKLIKALYGLRQAPRVWYYLLRTELEAMGFEALEPDPCVFIKYDEKGNCQLIVCVWVDDILIFSGFLDIIEDFKQHIASIFKMTDEGECSYYLGMHLERTEDSIKLHQKSYIEQMLNRYNLADRNISPIMVKPDSKLRLGDKNKVNEALRHEYQSKAGSLNFLATCTRPDISFSIGFLSRFNSAPEQKHMDQLNQVFDYTNGTKSHGLTYTKSVGFELAGYVDSDFAGCEDTRKSTSGWVFMLAGGPVSWSSKRQSLTTLSTMEAEYVAASEASREAIWIKNLINGLHIPELQIEGIPVHQVKLYIDNEAALKLTKNPEFHARSKHIDIKYHYVREQVEDGTICPLRVDSENNLADILTKPLNKVKLKKAVKMLRLDKDATDESQGELTDSGEPTQEDQDSQSQGES